MKRIFRIGKHVANVSHDVERELDHHIEMKARELESQGMTPGDAWIAALKAFGDRPTIEAQVREEREATMRHRSWQDWWAEVKQDVTVALRGLRRTPGFTIVALLTLALGIGANSAIFGVVRSTLLRPLPYPGSDRMVQVWTDYRQANGRSEPEWLTPPDFLEWRDQNRTFEAMAAYGGWGPDLTGSGDPVSLNGLSVSGDYFNLLQIPAALGRTLTPADDVDGVERTVVLSDAIWRSRFGADPGILGRQLQLGGEPWTVVGVMPRGFRPPLQTTPPDVFRTFMRPSSAGCGRGCIVLRAIGRMKPGVTIEQAQADLAGIAARQAEQFPETNKGVTSWLIPLKDQIVGPTREPLMALFGAIGFVLLIACVNLASLLLVRGAGRSRELAVRAALGAGRGRLVRQLLVESGVLAAVGGALGLGIGILGARTLGTIVPVEVRSIQGIQVDGFVVGFTALVTCVAGVLSGVLPALQSAGGQLMTSIRGGGQQGGRGVGRTLNGLVVAELSLAVIMLVGAGLLLRSFQRMQQVDLGYRSKGAVVYSLGFPRTRYADAPRIRNAVEDLISRLRANSAIKQAEVVDIFPLSAGDNDIEITAMGEAPPEGLRSIWTRRITSGYPDLMQFKLSAGRDFTPQDREGAPPVAILNQEAVRHFFGAHDPIGRTIRLGSDSTAVATVVGVLASSRHDGPNQPYKFELFVPFSQRPSRNISVVIEPSRDMAAAVAAYKSALAEVDPLIPAGEPTSIEQMVGQATASPRLNAILIGGFAGVAMLLAMLGVYGVMAYVVAQRQREIGVRLALGAAPSGIRRLVFGQAGRLAAIGLVVGLAGAIAVAQLIRSLLFQVSVFDLTTLLVVPMILAVMATLACWIPARRAVRMDPLVAIRSE